MAESKFSLVEGGLAHRIEARIWGVRSPDALHTKRRALFLALVAWLPLAIAAWVKPNPSDVTIAFFQDVAAHVRFLLVLPMLVLIEKSIDLRTRIVAHDVVASGLVPEDDLARFDVIVRRTRRRIESAVADLVLLVIAYVLVLVPLRVVSADASVFWFEDASLSGIPLTGAGWWYAMVACPMVTFLFLRWVWRYLVWSWFLWRVSRLRLRLAASHPDRVGGLGFVNIGQTAFAAVPFAASCVLAGAAANRIFHEGVRLQTYQVLILTYVIVSIVIGLLPMLAFVRPLVVAKLSGLVRYGRLSSRYVYSFEEKWLGEKPTDEKLLGTGDIQSLADIGGSFERVNAMRPVPFDRRTIIAFAFAAASPMLPLFLTVMPLREMVRLVVKAML